MTRSTSIIDVADPARLMTAVGFQVPEVYSALVNTSRFRAKIEARLEEQVTPLPELDSALAEKLSALFDLVVAHFDLVSRGLISLGQGRRIALSTDGTEMSALAEFYGDKTVLKFLLQHRNETPAPLLVLERVSIAQLEDLRPLSRLLLLGCLEAHHRDKLYLMGVIEQDERDCIDLERSDRDQILACAKLIKDELLNASGDAADAVATGDDNAAD